jgi:two-component system sensor histidine kinase YesM
MSILESDIYSLIEKESKDKSIFIIDEQGIILSSKDKNMIKENLSQFISTGYNDGQEGKFDDTYNREQVLVTYNTTKFGWKTVSIIPYSTFMTSAQTVTRHILALALASTCFSALLIYVAARLFSKRVEYLLRITQRVETGDFSVRIAPLGHDEIGQLGFAFNHMLKRLNSLITEVYKKEIDKKEAEMNLLQSQINPHFLYNTLASISSLAIQNHDQRMYKIVSDLAKFYRISLNKGKNVLSIHEEIQLTRYYVSILQIRFDGMLRVHYDIDESVLPCPIVKLTLQPFVENCINHAIWDDKLGINIIIKAYRDGEYIILKVIDDGMGCRQTAKSSIPEEDHKTFGYGIQNVDQRIKLFFGNTCGVTFYSKLGIGSTVQIRILG